MTRSTRAARTLLWLSFPVFVVFGLLGVATPHLLANLVSIALDSPTSLADFRAIYGGVSLGLGAFMFAALRRDEWVYPAVALDGACLAGAGLSRVYSWMISGTPSAIIFVLAAVELSVAVAAARICRRVQRSAVTASGTPAPASGTS